jgi:hypothetical protein
MIGILATFSSPYLAYEQTYDLKFHGLAIQFDSADFLRHVRQHNIPARSPAESRSTYEVNTDGRNVAFRVGIIGESEQQTRLSNTGVSDEEELEEVIVSISVRKGRSVTRCDHDRGPSGSRIL